MNNIENFNSSKLATRIATGALTFSLLLGGCQAAPESRSITTESVSSSSTKEPSITEPPYTRETNPPKQTTTQESYSSITEPPYTRETNPPKRPTVTEGTTKLATTEIESKYDLKKVTPERFEFTKNLLAVYDNSVNDSDPSNIQKYLNANQIIKYGETGKGLEVIEDKHNQPLIALVNCDKDTVNGLNIAIKNLEKIDSYAVNRLNRNGIKVIVNTDTNGQDPISNTDGVLAIQYKSDKDIDPKQDYRLTIAIARESFSIREKQLGGKYESQDKVLSSLLLSNCFWYQYQKTGEKVYEALSYYNYLPYQTLRNSNSLAAEEIQSMVKDIQDNSLIEAYGSTWDKINNSTHNRADWHIGATM